ncbi:hypothetical protein [Streptomyces sp. col6]|uniref:hypothetical protein n=1 Tax=Streptomyces sp. col6 TaxID=2478958 RepID=UPI001CD0B7E0|nr:hypothetical protein [Streptomyces sp. col6]
MLARLARGHAFGQACDDAFVVTDAEWTRMRKGLRFGQVFEGTVVQVPRPGAIGIFVDIGLSVGGFVDVLLLPEQSEDWLVEGTVADFEIWWADSRQQIRLKPADSRYLRCDFADFVERVRPHWPTEIGQPVRDPGPPTLDEMRSAADAASAAGSARRTPPVPGA